MEAGEPPNGQSALVVLLPNWVTPVSLHWSSRPRVRQMTLTASSTPTRMISRLSPRDSSTWMAISTKARALKGHSSLREEDLDTGRILKFQHVPDQYFAEGLTNWGNTLIQLTWQTHIAFVYDRATFRLLTHFPLRGRGLGPYPGWQKPYPQRWHRHPALPRSHDLRRSAAHRGQRSRHACHPAQRTRIHPRPDLRQHLALQSHRPHLARNR